MRTPSRVPSDLVVRVIELIERSKARKLALKPAKKITKTKAHSSGDEVAPEPGDGAS